MGPYSISTLQLEVALGFFNVNLRFCRRRPELQLGPGRGQNSLYKLLNELQDQLSSAGCNLGRRINDLANVSRDVDPDRIALADPAGTFDPPDVLPPGQRAAFLHPEARVIDGGDAESNVLVPCHRVGEEDEEIIRRRLLSK